MDGAMIVWAMQGLGEGFRLGVSLRQEQRRQMEVLNRATGGTAYPSVPGLPGEKAACEYCGMVTLTPTQGPLRCESCGAPLKVKEPAA